LGLAEQQRLDGHIGPVVLCGGRVGGSGEGLVLVEAGSDELDDCSCLSFVDAENTAATGRHWLLGGALRIWG